MRISAFSTALLCVAALSAHAAVTVQQTESAQGRGVSSITLTFSSAIPAGAFVIVLLVDEVATPPVATVTFGGTAGLSFSNRYLSTPGQIACNYPGGVPRSCDPYFSEWCAFSAGGATGTLVANFSTTVDTAQMIAFVAQGSAASGCASVFDTNMGFPYNATNYTTLNSASAVTPMFVNITGPGIIAGTRFTTSPRACVPTSALESALGWTFVAEALSATGTGLYSTGDLLFAFDLSTFNDFDPYQWCDGQGWVNGVQESCCSPGTNANSFVLYEYQSVFVPPPPPQFPFVWINE